MKPSEMTDAQLVAILRDMAREYRLCASLSSSPKQMGETAEILEEVMKRWGK